DDIRDPAIEDQNGAILGALVPSLVLDGIVERNGFAFTPFASFAADPERTAGRDEQRTMNDRARVGYAGVRRNVFAGLQQRKEHRGSPSRDTGERKLLDDLRGF